MVLEPGVAEDHALFPKAGDGEEHPFRMGLVTEDYIYHFRDLSCFVREAVYIEHQYRTRDVPGANTLRTDKVFIYEVAHSSGVQKRLNGMYFASVSSTDLYRKDNRHSVGVEGVGRESSG